MNDQQIQVAMEACYAIIAIREAIKVYIDAAQKAAEECENEEDATTLAAVRAML